eukprot:4505762-Pyramimonas_sp.AAC.1
MSHPKATPDCHLLSTYTSLLMHYVSLAPGPYWHRSLMSHPGGTTGGCDIKGMPPVLRSSAFVSVASVPPFCAVRFASLACMVRFRRPAACVLREPGTEKGVDSGT